MTMWDLIYTFTTWVARVHERVLQINDAGGWYFDDKQLHFIVFGIFGMALIFVLYPLFKILAKHDHTMVITWLYVFTVIIVGIKAMTRRDNRKTKVYSRDELNIDDY